TGSTIFRRAVVVASSARCPLSRDVTFLVVVVVASPFSGSKCCVCDSSTSNQRCAFDARAVWSEGTGALGRGA
uniref:Uncharacterized protein n=1 Tax=Anopheles albimanus TaxID=7167 RepID=A0A182FXT4_ANOAL